jgi:hypothetical protein
VSVTSIRYGRLNATVCVTTCPALQAMPTAAAAAPTVPFSPTCRVAACWTKAMQQACGDSAEKSADEVNARPMPSRLSSSFMSPLALRLTFGSETCAVSVITLAPDEASSPLIERRAVVVGRAQVPDPGGGSSAVMDSFPPWYGSETAVQPPTAAYR